MSLITKLLKYISDSNYRFKVNAVHGMYNYMPDEEYIKRIFKATMGYELNLDNPQTYNEKLQWLKLYDRKSIYSKMVDKYEAKKYVAEIIGEEFIIPTLGLWNEFEDINFDMLPDQFVLKCTHDSGGIVICKDKLKFNIKNAKEKINRSLRRNYYYKYREWPYKNIKPRIIAEAYLEGDRGSAINDYKLQCFDGKFDNIFVAEGRFTKKGIRYHYFDRDWKYLPYCLYDDVIIEDLQKLRPTCYEKMICISETLSMGLPELRVDLYEISGKVYFGELTFYSQSGLDIDITYDADCILGSKLTLPMKIEQ